MPGNYLLIFEVKHISMLTNQLSNSSDLVVEGSVVGVDGRRCHAPPGDDHWWMMMMMMMMVMMTMMVVVVVMIIVVFFSVLVMVEGAAPHLERSTGFESFLKFSLSTH